MIVYKGNYCWLGGSKSSVSTTCTSATTSRIDKKFISPRTTLIVALNWRASIIFIIMIIRCSWVDGLIFRVRPDTCKTPIIHWYSWWLILESRIATINVVICVLVDVVSVWIGYKGCMNRKCTIGAFIHNRDSQLLDFTIGRVLVSSACASSHLNYVGLSLSRDINLSVTLNPKACLTWGRGWCSTITRIPDNKGRASAIAEITNVQFIIIPGPDFDCVN